MAITKCPWKSKVQILGIAAFKKVLDSSMSKFSFFNSRHLAAHFLCDCPLFPLLNHFSRVLSVGNSAFILELACLLYPAIVETISKNLAIIPNLNLLVVDFWNPSNNFLLPIATCAFWSPFWYSPIKPDCLAFVKEIAFCIVLRLSVSFPCSTRSLFASTSRALSNDDFEFFFC